ncbi:MAG: PQQ-dependent sugar dehydrogenase [Micropruina sp.]|nr:PQQ-dependent sugar dehydrogenase [Micropruina sp.]
MAIPRLLICALTGLTLVGCTLPAVKPASPPVPTGHRDSHRNGSGTGRPFSITAVDRFNEPWAMTFLPGADHLLITERGGALLLRDQALGKTITVTGTPAVAHAGQGGLGDVIPGPNYATDKVIYLSWAENAEGGTRAVVGRAVLETDGTTARLTGLNPIWQQTPATTGSGHFGHRLAISPDGAHLFVSSGDRQKFDPAQDLGSTLGKVLRLNLDGTPAAGNPFAERGLPTSEIWSYGHRNPLGLAFDPAGNLWDSEMGPRGGDEVNLIQPGRNYGWPQASNGSHYDGRDIPDHQPGDGFEAPGASWNPSISPGSLINYRGSRFPQWRGDAFVGALSGEALIRIDLEGTTATKAEQWDLGQPIREVEEAPDGTLWLLEDANSGRLLHLT